MKKLTNATKGDDLGTPRGRDNGEGQAGKTSEFSKKLPLPAIETDPDFPATVLSAATMHIRHKPALQRDVVQTTTKPTFHRQLSAQRKADLPRLIPGRCSPPNLPGRPQGPCGDLPHRTVEGSNKRDRSSGSSQKHLVNPPWAPCKVVDPTYIGNICFDRLPKGLKHLEPVDLCYRHGHHRRLNPLGKAQNEGPQRRSCTNLRAHVHKQKVQEKKIISVAVVKTEASTDDKPKDVDVSENRNRKSLDIDTDSCSKPDDPCELLKPESSFVSSTEYQTDNNSCRSSSSVSKEQGETYPRDETSQVTEQSCQMPSSANGDCQPQSTTFCQTIPTCKLAENLQQTTQGFLSQERVEKVTLTFSVSSEISLSDDELKGPDENPRNKNSSKPHIERRGSLSFCMPKGKLRTDEVSKSFSALSSKEKEHVNVGMTNLQHTMPHHEHRGEMVEKHVCTDVDITKETVPVVPEPGDDARKEVKTTGQQQEETSHEMLALGSTVVETPVTRPATSPTQVVINTGTKTDVSDELSKPVLVDSFVNTVATQHRDSEEPTSVCDTEISSHKLLSLSDEVSKGTPGDPPKVGMHSKVPVRNLAGKIHEPSTKKIIKQTLPPAFRNDPSEESYGSVGRHRPEQEKLKYSKISHDVPFDPTSTRCKVDRACTNKTRSKLKTKTKKGANSATAKMKETSSERESEKPKPIIVEKTLCSDESKPETVLFGPGSQLETVDPDTGQESFEVYPDLAIGVRLFRTPVDEVRPRVSDLEIQPLDKENRPPSEAQTEGEHQTLDVGEKVGNAIIDALPMIQRKSKDDCTATHEKESLPVVEAVPKRQPVIAEDIKNDQHKETCGRVMDKEKVILTKPEEVVITEEDNMQNETRNGVTLIATDVDITPQSDVKKGMDNEKNFQGMTEKSELPSLKNVDEEVDLGEGESLTMYVPPLPCSSATQELTTDGLSQDRLPCRWRINLDANRLDHLLQVQDNLREDGSRGCEDWKERPVNYVDPNVPLEDMLTKYFTDHTPLDSAFRAINIVNSYSSSISYNSHQAQERVVAALQSIKQEEVYKHAVICPLASQCANATHEFGESLYKAFRRFSNRSRAAQEAMIEYYRGLAEGEITSPEMVKQIKRDGRKLYMVWEGGRYVTRYAEDDECTGGSDETVADDDTTDSLLTHNHNPASDRK